MYRFEEPDGKVVGAIGHLNDVTERKQTEQLLKDEISRRRILVDQSRDGIVVLDENGKVYEANKEFARMLGYPMDEIYQLYVWDWDSQYEKEAILEMIRTVDTAGDHFETCHRRKDGTLCQVEISTNGAVYAGKKYVFCICRDITEKKALEEQIRELAIRDPLTNVYNRRYIFERLAETTAEYSRGEKDFCVSILDIDHFKVVNDTFGHQAGDFILKEFARTVGSLIRQYDLLGRYGGEEFIIVSTNAGEAETSAMIGRVMEEIRNSTFVFEGNEIRFTFSCGIADSLEFQQGKFSVEALVNLADKRLYAAKAAGRDRCVGSRCLDPVG